MGKFKRLLGVFIVVSIGIGVALFFSGYFKPKGGGVFIETNPTANVIINGNSLGRTPYQGNFKAGEIVLKLVPNSGEVPLVTYETKVTLTPGVQTVIRRDFKDSLEASSGEIISFENTSNKQASLSIVSSPDAAKVTMDGQVKGFTPLRVSSVTPSQHTILVSADGYNNRVVAVTAVRGHRLTAVIKLEEEKNFQDPEELKVLENSDSNQILILDTPTGFLRVRQEPSTSSTEIGQATPGEKYDLLEEGENGEWFKIAFDELEGWVSATYASQSAQEN